MREDIRMALIKCSNCGKDVSDKAFECPQCGEKLIEKEMPKRICEECGKELEDEEIVCSRCGCPVTEENNQENSKKNVRFNKRVIAVLTLVIVAIIGVIFVIKNIQKNIAEQERIQISEDYETNLELASSMMLTGAAKAEDVGGLIHDVWYNTIYEESDSETDRYTKTSGRFNDDFNDSLKTLFADSSFQLKISSIESNQESVKTIMKELTNPPQEYSEAYNALKEYYDAYLEFTNLVINPTGSLQTFTSNFNDSDSAVAKYYEAMKIYID